jgi:tRNA pseudouridine(38-40) synthase
MIVAYDGSDYYGWQWQPNQPTVVGALQTTFKQAFLKDIHLVGASRTDAGVHALGQVATFTTELPIESRTLQEVWNRQLPSSIVIRSLSIMIFILNAMWCKKHIVIICLESAPCLLLRGMAGTMVILVILKN